MDALGIHQRKTLKTKEIASKKKSIKIKYVVLLICVLLFHWKFCYFLFTKIFSTVITNEKVNSHDPWQVQPAGI